MKIAIVSDTHFGYGWDTDREDDAFSNAREAFTRTQDADLVLLPGDIYDNKVPKQEVLSRSIDCFNIYRDGDCNLTFAADSDVTYDFDGTPVIAIHGTHERRTQGFVNPIQLLDKMGYLLHVHNEVAVFEHPETGERVAVHGMSGVPERYAPGVLEKFSPEPVEDAYNIFVFHQSVENFVYTSKDHASLKLEHLPDGFDLLVDGHIHWYDLSNKDEAKPLILPGSTISTQMRKIEAEKPKGFVTVDTDTDDVQFHALETPREQFYEEIDVDSMSSSEILSAVDDRMDEILDNSREKRPLVRIVLQGETDATVTQRDIHDRYEEDAILSVSTRFAATDTAEVAQSFREQTQSIGELGQQMLRNKLADTNSLQVEQLFELLAEERPDDAVELVEEMDIDLKEKAQDNEETDEEQSSDGMSTESEHEQNTGDTVTDNKDATAKDTGTKQLTDF